MTYVMFSCEGNPISAEKCTTRWPEGLAVAIPIGGMIDGKFYNLLAIDGDESLINSWVAENAGKIEIIDKAQANQLGQALVVPGSTRTEKDEQTKEAVTMTAGTFDLDSNTSLWTETGRAPWVEPEPAPMSMPDMI